MSIRNTLKMRYYENGLFKVVPDYRLLFFSWPGRDPMVLVSACLIGLSCRYDGEARPSHQLINRLRGRYVLPVCPEQLGGLPTPRVPANIHYGDGMDVLIGRARVLTIDGDDVTEAFKRGAEQTVSLAVSLGIKQCFLKAKSPSCGISPQIGVTSARLILEGLDIEEID